MDTVLQSDEASRKCASQKRCLDLALTITEAEMRKVLCEMNLPKPGIPLSFYQKLASKRSEVVFDPISSCPVEKSWTEFLAHIVSRCKVRRVATNKRCSQVLPDQQPEIKDLQQVQPQQQQVQLQHQELLQKEHLAVAKQAQHSGEVTLPPLLEHQLPPIHSPMGSPSCAHAASPTLQMQGQDQCNISSPIYTGPSLDPIFLHSPEQSRTLPACNDLCLASLNNVDVQLLLSPTFHQTPSHQPGLSPTAHNTMRHHDTAPHHLNIQQVANHGFTSTAFTYSQLLHDARDDTPLPDTLSTLECVKQVLLRQIQATPVSKRLMLGESAPEEQNHLSTSSPVPGCRQRSPKPYTAHTSLLPPQDGSASSSPDVASHSAEAMALDNTTRGHASDSINRQFIPQSPAQSSDQGDSNDPLLGRADALSESEARTDTSHKPPPPPSYLSSIFELPAVTQPWQPVLMIYWTLLTRTRQMSVSKPRPVPVLSSMALVDAAGMFLEHVNQNVSFICGTENARPRAIKRILSHRFRAIPRSRWNDTAASIRATMGPRQPYLHLFLEVELLEAPPASAAFVGMAVAEPFALYPGSQPVSQAIVDPTGQDPMEEELVDVEHVAEEPSEQQPMDSDLVPGPVWGAGEPVVATMEEQQFYTRVMRRHHLDKIMVTHVKSQLALKRSFLHCLRSGIWLNDEVINLYVILLQERAVCLQTPGSPVSKCPRPAAPRCHFFSSFFCEKLCRGTGGYTYANVKRWTTRKKLQLAGQLCTTLLHLDRVIIIKHCGVHWTCAVIDLKAKALFYLDSLRGEDRVLLDHLARWVEDEALDKLKETWDTSFWPRYHPKDIPRQRNGCDCGVFALMFANYLGLGRPMHWGHRDMDVFRIKILSQLKANWIE